MSKYGVISGPYFPVFRLNTGKHGLEIKVDFSGDYYFKGNQNIVLKTADKGGGWVIMDKNY